MVDLFQTIFSFVFALALLIAVHEWGHFSMARVFNIKVLKFSIGFGKTLFQYKGIKDNTEFVLAWIPLGGYVKMLGENDHEVPQNEQHRSFLNQSVYKRFLVVAAGPVVNFIFAVLAFWAMYIIGIQGIKTQIGSMDNTSIAWQSGFRQGDIIESVNDQLTPTWSSFYETLLPYFIDRKNVAVKTADNHVFILKIEQIANDIEVKDMKKSLGFSMFIPEIPALVGKVIPNSAADKAGIKLNDKILMIDGSSINSWSELVEYVRNRPDTRMNVIVLGNDEQQRQIEIISQSKIENGEKIGILGIVNKIDPEITEQLFVNNDYQTFPALIKAAEKTWDLSILTLKMIGKMVSGQASWENVSGPITIAEVAGVSYQQGIEYFLRFLAIVSLSLGVINLLPIPVLDGGHLLFYLLEMIKGSPVSTAVQEFMLKLGVVILVMLMSVAIYNDLNRLLQ